MDETSEVNIKDPFSHEEVSDIIFGRIREEQISGVIDKIESDDSARRQLIGACRVSGERHGVSQQILEALNKARDLPPEAFETVNKNFGVQVDEGGGSAFCELPDDNSPFQYFTYTTSHSADMPSSVNRIILVTHQHDITQPPDEVIGIMNELKILEAKMAELGYELGVGYNCEPYYIEFTKENVSVEELEGEIAKIRGISV